MTETINGLHCCKPGNDPKQGEVKTFIVQQMTSKKGKPYLKIKAASSENGGTPYRVLSVESTGFVDGYGNNSFNLEIEPAILSGGGGPEAREPDKSTPPTQSIERVPPFKPDSEDRSEWRENSRKAPAQSPQAPPARTNGSTIQECADYAAKVFAVNWMLAVKWIGTLPQKDLEEMSVYEYYDLQMRHAQHGSIETGKIIRRERF